MRKKKLLLRQLSHNLNILKPIFKLCKHSKTPFSFIIRSYRMKWSEDIFAEVGLEIFDFNVIDHERHVAGDKLKKKKFSQLRAVCDFSSSP